MDEYKIEKGVPMPTRAGDGRTKYPWRQMEVGDSFFTEVRFASMTRGRADAQNATGFKFAMRKENGGTRVWRIA